MGRMLPSPSAAAAAAALSQTVEPSVFLCRQGRLLARKDATADVKISPTFHPLHGSGIEEDFLGK